MKVGIDLSSANTGLVILNDNNELIFKGVYHLWDETTHLPNINEIEEMILTIYSKNLNRELISVGVELSNFKNANITNRFNMIFGAIYYSSKTKVQPYMAFKLFNSNEWQQHLGLNSTMERQFRKDTARQFVKSNCVDYKDTWTEDECDAYCIAYFLEHLRDRVQMHQEVKEKRIQAKKSKLAEKNEEIRKLKKRAKLNEIIARYDKRMAEGKKLTKSQINAQKKAIKELEELNNGNKQNI